MFSFIHILTHFSEDSEISVNAAKAKEVQP